MKVSKAIGIILDLAAEQIPDPEDYLPTMPKRAALYKEQERALEVVSKHMAQQKILENIEEKQKTIHGACICGHDYSAHVDGKECFFSYNCGCRHYDDERK